MSGIQGRTLEVTVVRCNHLKLVQRIGTQDPYVCLEYANDRYHTRTCTGGGRNPVFQDKFTFSIVEGLREMNISVYNSHTWRAHDFIGKGRVSLQTVISQGHDEPAWSIYNNKGKSVGEVCLVLNFPTLAPTYYPLPPPPPPTNYYPPPAPFQPPPPYHDPAPYPPGNHALPPHPHPAHPPGQCSYCTHGAGYQYPPR